MIELTVKTLDSQNHTFSLEDDQITVRGFKEHIAESVAVPADSQRLIYCGRVLQDEKKLNDYDVNGKVIHLVQRAPPQPGQRGNDGAPGQSQNHRQTSQNSQRPHYRLTRAQMHGNAMYLGAMSVPAEIVEGRGLPQLSNSLSGSRLNHAGRMLDRINDLIDRLDDPNVPLHPTASEVNQPASPQQPLETEDENNLGSRTNGGARLAEAAAAAITAALSAAGARAVTLFRGGNYDSTDARGSSDVNGEQENAQRQQQSQPQPQSRSHSQSQPQLESQSQPEIQLHAQPQSQSQIESQIQRQLQSQPEILLQAQPRSQSQESPQRVQPPTQSQSQPHVRSQPQAQPQESTQQQDSSASSSGQNTRQQEVPRPRQMAELLQRLYNIQERLRPYLERYCVVMLLDPALPLEPGLTMNRSQRIVDGVSEILHNMSHACHALSDIIIDMNQPPPRNLRCRPIIVQHSAILQPSIPIQVEAHISLNGRNANNNTNDGPTESGNQAQSDNTESLNVPHVNVEEGNQERESDNITSQSQAEQSQQEQNQSPFGTVFNLPNNVEVLMEVTSENNIEGTPGNEQNTANEARINGGTNTFPWGAAPSPYFMRNFMQAFAGHMVHGGITSTSTTRNPVSVGGQQGTSSSMDNGNTNAGQSTQARSNVGTHPTTATQTRSTSRPHVFHHHTHPVGLGMSVGLGLDFDPYLPCNSHHVYRTPTSTPNSGISSSQTTRTVPTTATATQRQTATTSTTTTSATPTNATSTSSETSNNHNPFVSILQHVLGAHAQAAPNISINSNAPELAEGLGNIMQMLGSGNIHVGFVSDSNSVGGAFTLADLFESGGLPMDLFTPQESGSREQSFLADLSVLMAQNMTLEGLVRLRLGQWEPVARLRRPLREFLQYSFSSTSTPDALQEQTIERLLSQLRPHVQSLLTSEEDASGRSGSRIDICATIEGLIAHHTRYMLSILFNDGIDDTRFGQEILTIVNNLGRQLCIVLRYSVRGGQAGLEAIASRFVGGMLEGVHPALRQWMLNGFIVHFRTYSLRIAQPPDSEVVLLLSYKDTSSQPTASASTCQSTKPQSKDEPMEAETLEQRVSEENLTSEDREEIPETFAGHETLPSDWVPIITRDGVRQRRQLQMQGVTNNSVATFSDAYLGGLPTKRRKLIEQQKPQLLVSPSPNHSTITASMERLVREGVGRAGVEEVEGAAVAVAADPAVRHAFGQAIRDCLNPCRYGTSDFPDPLRFPNATKYFTDQERPPK